MPSRNQTIDDAIRIFENSEFPNGLNLATAWLGIYQTLLWYEDVNWLGYGKLPHIIDADKLRPSTTSKQKQWNKPKIWQQRAASFNSFLAEHIGCSNEQTHQKTDLLMKKADYEGMQRQNTLGIAFAGLVKHILERFGSSDIAYQTEIEASVIFPGIAFPGRSTTPRIDLLARRSNMPLAIISAKWSVRHDRLSDITNECPVYKAAYERIYRQAGREHLLYYVITNEYDPSRLNKMLADTCMDGIIHVHKNAVVEVCRLNGRLSRLIDIEDFVQMTSSW